MENEKADCNCKHCMGILHCSNHWRRNHSAVTANFPSNLICKAREKLLFIGAAFYHFPTFVSHFKQTVRLLSGERFNFSAIMMEN